MKMSLALVLASVIVRGVSGQWPGMASAPIDRSTLPKGPPLVFATAIQLSEMFPPYSVEAPRILKGYEFWRDWANSRGGILVNNTVHPVELLVENVLVSEQTTKMAEVYGSFIANSSVDFLLGAYGSSTVEGDAFELLKNSPKIAMTSAASAQPFGGSNLFSIMPDNGNEWKSTMRALYLKGARSVAMVNDIIYIAYPQLSSLSRLFKDSLTGMHLVGMYSVPPAFTPYMVNHTVYAQVIAQLRAQDPDVVILSVFNVPTQALWSHMLQQDYLPKALVTYDQGIQMLPNFGSNMTYLLGTSQWFPDINTEVDDQLGTLGNLSKYLAEIGSDCAHKWVAIGVASGLALQLAIEEADSLVADDVHHTLMRKSEQASFFGPIAFNKYNQLERSAYSVQYVNDESCIGAACGCKASSVPRRVVAPFTAATASIQWPVPDFAERACKDALLGAIYSRVDRKCECPAMHARVSNSCPGEPEERCLELKPGHSASLEQCQIIHTRCPFGTYSEGSLECTDCPQGTFADGKGFTSCEPCNVGFFQAANGSKICTRCVKGTYQENMGQSACDECSATQTTQGPGSVSMKDCGCAPGSFMQDLQCQPCPEGMSCAGFRDEILVLPSWYSSTIPADPSAGVWRCTNEIVCIGQANSSDALCAPNSAGLNCARCKEGTSRSSDGTCEDCADGSVALVPIFMLICFLLCGVFHYAWNHRTQSVELVESVLASVTIGVTLAFMQQVGIMHKLSFNWPIEFESILSVVALFLFDLDFLSISCAVPESFEFSYIVALLVPAVISGFFILWLFLSKLFHMVFQRFPAYTWSAIINSIGMVAQALYISIVSSSISLFMCYESGPDGERALTIYPWELCYSSAWYSMLPLGIIAILFYVVGFFGLLVWMSYVAPIYWEHPTFRVKSRFLVFKYRTDKWWFGVALMLRALALALVPVVSPDDGYVQFFLLLFILVGAVVLHLIMLPYADGYANRLETIELSILVVILSIGSWFIESRDLDGKDKSMAFRLSIVLCISFAVCACALFGTFCYAAFFMAYPKLAAQNYKQQLCKVQQTYAKTCAAFAKLDEEAQIRVLSQASYIDLLQVEAVANFQSVLLTGTLPRRLSQQRLDDGSVSRSVSGKLSSMSEECTEQKEPDNSSPLPQTTL